MNEAGRPEKKGDENVVNGFCVMQLVGGQRFSLSYG